jgi:hypothetical protein
MIEVVWHIGGLKFNAILHKGSCPLWLLVQLPHHLLGPWASEGLL